MGDAWHTIGDFLTNLPAFIVWLGGILYCAYRYEEAPVRFILVGCLLALMVFVTTLAPFVELTLASSWAYRTMGYYPSGPVPLILDAGTTVFVYALPPVVIGAIALFTRAPEAPS